MPSSPCPAGQVSLDPTFHDGVSRPLAPIPGGLTAAQLLLAGPLPFSTVLLVALDSGTVSTGRTALGTLGAVRSTTPAAATAAAQLPRLLKLLHKEVRFCWGGQRLGAQGRG